MIEKRNLALTVSRASVYEKYNNVVWMVSNRSAVLLKLDLNINRIIEAYKIPTEINMEYGYISMIEKNNSLFIFPYNERNIVIFNIHQKEFSIIEIPLEAKYKKTTNMIGCICEQEEYIYIIGAELPFVYEYDINKKNFRKLYENDYEGRFTIADSMILNGILYVPESERNIIHKIDIKQGSEVSLYFDKTDVEGITSFTCWNNKMYFATRSGNIYRLNDKGEFSDCGKVSDDYIYRVNVYDSRLFFFELFKGNVNLLDLEKNQKHVLNCVEEQEKMNFKGSKIEMVIKKDHEIIYQKRSTGELYRIDVLRNEITKIDVIINEDIKDKLVKFELESDSTIKEGENISLLDFLDNILNKDK